MTGPLYQQSRGLLPQASQAHRIPSDYWKVVAVQQDERLQVAGFLLSQSAERGDDYCDHVVPLAAIETASGLQFFHGIDAQPDVSLAPRSSQLLDQLGCAGGE